MIYRVINFFSLSFSLSLSRFFLPFPSSRDRGWNDARSKAATKDFEESKIWISMDVWKYDDSREWEISKYPISEQRDVWKLQGTPNFEYSKIFNIQEMRKYYGNTSSVNILSKRRFTILIYVFSRRNSAISSLVVYLWSFTHVLPSGKLHKFHHSSRELRPKWNKRESLISRPFAKNH